MALLPWFRALHIAATLLIGGALAFEFLILRRCGDAARNPSVAAVMDRWIARQCACGVALGLVSWVGWLAAIAMAMSGLAAQRALSPEVLGTVVTQTTFGQVWVIRLALFIVLAALVMRRRAGPAFSVALILVASLAWTGHALGTNAVHVWVDAAHLLAAAAWLGMLPLLWLVTNRAVTHITDWRELGIGSARQFFLPGLIAVVVLAASGLANTSWMVDSVSDLFATNYGRVLSTKLALFALMLALAIVNRLVIVPRAQRAADTAGSLRWLRISVLAELMLGASIVGVVAWLGVTPPVAHEHVMHQMQGM